MNEWKLVEVYRAKNSPQAYLIKSALESEGIGALIEGDLLQGALGEVPVGWTTTPRVLVQENDLQLAREIIKEAEWAALATLSSSHEKDTCLACGTLMLGKDETCTACGWSYSAGNAD